MGIRANLPRFGGGPNKLQLDGRLKIAKERLVAGWKLRDVALALGYTKASSFSDAFVSLTGVRPGTWGEQERERRRLKPKVRRGKKREVTP